MNFIRSILPPYIVPIMPEMSLIDEPVMCPYSQNVLPKSECSGVALERFKLMRCGVYICGLTREISPIPGNMSWP